MGRSHGAVPQAVSVVFRKERGSWILGILGVGILLGLTLYAYHQDTAKKKIRRVRADLVHSSDDQHLQKFNLTGYDEQGKKFWNLEGEVAKIDPVETVFLDQNVTLKLKDSTVVTTNHVRWSPQAGLLTTDSPVFVTHQSTNIQGLGAVGRPNESFIQINRNVRMVIDNATQLTCLGPMKIYYKENKAVFYRKVKVTDAKGFVSSNRMDVFFNGETKKVSQIVAVGKVTIERDGNITHSERAIYNVATGSVRLEGSPEITLYKESSSLLDAPLRS
jgi:LPS export ABC transporter protein LptC